MGECGASTDSGGSSPDFVRVDPSHGVALANTEPDQTLYTLDGWPAWQATSGRFEIGGERVRGDRSDVSEFTSFVRDALPP